MITAILGSKRGLLINAWRSPGLGEIVVHSITAWLSLKHGAMMKPCQGDGRLHWVLIVISGKRAAFK